MKQLPLGISDFKEIQQQRLYFVDKSRLIQELFENPEKVTLITRPRRFGKTLNLSMLYYFFDLNEANANRALFDGLAIAQEQALLTEHQGKYSTIFMSFRNVKASTYDAVYRSIQNLMAELYKEHRYLREKLSADDQIYFDNILLERADLTNTQGALKNLIRYLHDYHNRPVMVLIDEYDAPIQAGIVHGFYDLDQHPEPAQRDRSVKFLMRGILNTLKDNTYLARAVLTGIMRVSGAGIFSHFNNFGAYTILDQEYSAHFGFTEAEVQEILREYFSAVDEQNLHLLTLRDWYNCYRFGKLIIYNH